MATRSLPNRHPTAAVSKTVALAILLAGAAFAIGAWNPIGEPNLHPNPWVVCSGAVVAAIGGWLIAYKVQPRQPGARALGIAVMVAMVGLALASLLF